MIDEALAVRWQHQVLGDAVQSAVLTWGPPVVELMIRSLAPGRSSPPF